MKNTIGIDRYTVEWIDFQVRVNVMGRVLVIEFEDGDSSVILCMLAASQIPRSRLRGIWSPLRFGRC